MDSRFVQDAGVCVYTGNELLIKGALESGVSMVTGYPGSPLAEVFETVRANADLFLEQGILAQIANNEALAAARLNGSQMRGMRAMMVMKCVGVHVASDALALGNLAGTHEDGGVLVVMGDDPWSEGTQVPADSRFIARHLFMPVLEPGGFQEIKDWVRAGFELSNASRCYIGYLLTSSQADGGGTVQVRPNDYSDITVNNPTELDPAEIDPRERVIIPPDTARKEVEVLQDRLPRLFTKSRELKLDRIIHAPAESTKQPFGFIASGVSYTYLEHALSLLGLSGAVPILKLGMVYPVDPEMVHQFADMVESVIVVEQKRDFIESQVTKVVSDLYQNGIIPQPVSVWGKQLPNGRPGIPSNKGLNASVIVEHLTPALLDMEHLPGDVDRNALQAEHDLIHQTAGYDVQIPARSPSFCPGCPHRDSASVINTIVKDFAEPHYMQQTHRRDAVQLIFHGDIGCYSMLKYPPFDKLMHNLSGMGLGGGTGAGIDPFITNKQVVFVGDSTFFHSALVAISDSIKNNQDITYIVLDNKTTAMTGHQPTPGTELDVLGQTTFAQQIDEISAGLADQEHVFTVRTNPEDRTQYRKLLEEVFLKDGVKVVVADKECGITFHRRKRQERTQIIKATGYLPHNRVVHITPEVCENCLECTRNSGCTALKFVETDYGRKMATDDSLCVADGSCMRVKACPSFEEIDIYRTKAPGGPETVTIEMNELPEPEFKTPDHIWCGYVAGVGGMGIGVVSAILARAGELQGYQIQFANKKGLAIRNGGVYAHVLYGPAQSRFSPTIPYGRADLLLGLDILEAVRGLDPKITLRIASPQYTTAVVNTSKNFTVSNLLGQDDFQPEDLCDILRTYTVGNDFVGLNAVDLAERLLGNKLYANLILVGAAFQKGTIPVSSENLLTAIRRTVGKRGVEQNLQAFHLGRQLALEQNRYAQSAAPKNLAEIIEFKSDMLKSDAGPRAADGYRALVSDALEGMALPEALSMDLARRVHDCIFWGGLDYAGEYVRVVKRIAGQDSAERGYAATRAVIWYAHKVMVIKDEVYVAHQLTCTEKQREDRRHYDINPARGDRMVYRHYNRPSFQLFGRIIEFDLTTYNWMLHAVKKMRFLRPLLPNWHRAEREFRDWYLALVDACELADDGRYETWVRMLELPEQVRGYRNVRYPLMQDARRQADELRAEMSGEEKPSKSAQHMPANAE
jgi:indolepyruvate ferredoxin oxidoreductase